MLKSKKLMKHFQYNFFLEPYNLYGLSFKETVIQLPISVTPLVKLDVVIYSLL